MGFRKLQRQTTRFFLLFRFSILYLYTQVHFVQLCTYGRRIPGLGLEVAAGFQTILYQQRVLLPLQVLTLPR